MFKFETLTIWQESIKFTAAIYAVTKTFPISEQFGLTSQMNRAAASISLNIAEGSGRETKTDFKRFIQIALGSLNEVVTCLHIAKQEKYITDKIFKEKYSDSESLAKMLYGFKKYLTK